MTNEKLTGNGARLISLRQKLAAREGKPEYKENCEHLRTEIARLESATLKSAKSENGNDDDD